MRLKSCIETIILQRGYLKKHIAKEVGITPAQLSNWIKMNNFPTADKLFLLAKVLNVKVDDLYEEIEE